MILPLWNLKFPAYHQFDKIFFETHIYTAKRPASCFIWPKKELTDLTVKGHPEFLDPTLRSNAIKEPMNSLRECGVLPRPIKQEFKERWGGRREER